MMALAATVVCASTLALSTAPADATGWYHGFRTPKLWVNGRQHMSSNLRGAAQFGHDVWNRTSTPVAIGWNDATPALVVRTTSLPPNIMGRFEQRLGDSQGYSLAADIYLDTAHIDSYLNGTWSAKIQGVYAHELGHALNLLDNPSTGRVSLMKYGSSGLAGGYYWPQPYDIEDVNYIYSRVLTGW